MWIVHLTGTLGRDGSRTGVQMWRCADCGVRTCCYRGERCTIQQSPFPHRWVPMGTGKTVFKHLSSPTSAPTIRIEGN